MAGEIKQFKDVNNNSHKVDISGVEGLSAALSGKAASTHTHTKSQITDFAHTHSQSDIIGLPDALANKLSSNVTVYNMPSEWTPKNLSTMVTGNLYLFVNNPGARLDTIINNDEGVTLNYHQNAGSTTNEFIMVRIYRWTSISSGVYALCEIVGAWNSQSN